MSVLPSGCKLGYPYPLAYKPITALVPLSFRSAALPREDSALVPQLFPENTKPTAISLAVGSESLRIFRFA